MHTDKYTHTHIYIFQGLLAAPSLQKHGPCHGKNGETPQVDGPVAHKDSTFGNQTNGPNMFSSQSLGMTPLEVEENNHDPQNPTESTSLVL